jgi:hypothetical protein
MSEPARLAGRWLVGTVVAVPVVMAFLGLSAVLLAGRSLVDAAGRAFRPTEGHRHEVPRIPRAA